MVDEEIAGCCVCVKALYKTMAGCTCNLGGLCNWIIGLTVLSIFSTTLIFLAEQPVIPHSTP